MQDILRYNFTILSTLQNIIYLTTLFTSILLIAKSVKEIDVSVWSNIFSIGIEFLTLHSIFLATNFDECPVDLIEIYIATQLPIEAVTHKSVEVLFPQLYL